MRRKNTLIHFVALTSPQGVKWLLLNAVPKFDSVRQPQAGLRRSNYVAFAGPKSYFHFPLSTDKTLQTRRALLIRISDTEV